MPRRHFLLTAYKSYDRSFHTSPAAPDTSKPRSKMRRFEILNFVNGGLIYSFNISLIFSQIEFITTKDYEFNKPIIEL